MRTPHLRLFSLLSGLLLLLLLPAANIAAETPLTGSVSWIYDGDTLEVEGVGKVRLLGIDTPEKQASARDDFYQQWQIPPTRLRDIARQATRFGINQTKCLSVNLIPGATRYDRHDRLLAYVYLPDGRLLNRLLLERGLATVFRRYDFSMKEDFLKAEEFARQQGLGLWEKP